jgi:TRAP-type C4-dicarboxylate transport system substrate-binding protein
MRKNPSLWLILVIGFVLLFSSLPAAEAQSASKPIVLKMSNYSNAPPIPYGNAITWYLRRIETATDHRVKFEEYWSGQLLPHRTEPEGLKAGMADLAFFQIRYQKARLPLFYVTCLPNAARDIRTAIAAMNDLAKMPAIQQEFDKFNMVLVAPGTTDKRGIFSKKPIRKLEDLKGMKIRSEASKILDGAGATTVNISSGEMYEALERGVIDGISTSITGGIAWKIPDISKYYWDGDLGIVSMCGFMNKKKWDSLPDDIKKIFLKVGHDELPVMYDYYLRARGNASAHDEIFPKRGIEVTRPTGKELAKMEEFSKGDWEAAISFLDKRKLPGRAVLDKWVKLNRYYEKFYAVAAECD